MSYSIIPTVDLVTISGTTIAPSSPQQRTSHCDVLFPSEKHSICSTWGDLFTPEKMLGSSRKMLGSMASFSCFSPKFRIILGFRGQLKQQRWIWMRIEHQAMTKPGSLLEIVKFPAFSQYPIQVANQPEGRGSFQGWPQWTQF